MTNGSALGVTLSLRLFGHSSGRAGTVQAESLEKLDVSTDPVEAQVSVRSSCDRQNIPSTAPSPRPRPRHTTPNTAEVDGWHSLITAASTDQPTHKNGDHRPDAKQVHSAERRDGTPCATLPGSPFFSFL